jgi:hypothetical protein
MAEADKPMVQVDLDVRDVAVWSTAIGATTPVRKQSNTYWALRAVSWIFLIFAAVLHPIVWIAVVFEAALFAILVAAQRLAKRTAHTSPAQTLNGRYQPSPSGFLRVSDFGETVVRWEAIDQITMTVTHLIVRFAGSGWVIPLRCFDSDDHRHQFLASLDAYASDSRKA